MKPTTIVVALALLVAPLAGCSPRPVPDAVRPSSDPRLAALSRVRPGSKVRLFTAATPLEARLASVAGDSVALLVGRRQQWVALARIDSAWVQVSGGGTGALIGAGILGAVYAFSFGSWAASMCDAECNTGGAVVWGAAAGASVGAMLGGLIGSATSHWRRAYPRTSP